MSEASVKELVASVRAVLGPTIRAEASREVLLDACEKVARHVSRVFSADPDEVAILLKTTDGKHLRFAAPRRMVDLGTIPITKKDSIAVNILGSKRGEAINNVRMVKHVAFFESVKLRERALPIQKMVTVPILGQDEEAIGVAQISRKGESASAAGLDFSESDVRRAEELFHAVGTLLASARPAKF